MEFKEKLISSHLAFEEDLYQNDSISQARATALKVFEEKGFPSKKEEAWKYTSLEALIKKDYALFPKSESSIEVNDVKKYFLYDTDTYKVIFISFLSELSEVFWAELLLQLHNIAITKKINWNDILFII